MSTTFEALRDGLLKNPEVALAYRELAPPILIGARIAARRADLGWSQMELASRAGITQRQVSAIERGRIDARLSTVSRLGDALGLHLELSYPRPQLCTGQSLGRLTVETAGGRNRSNFHAEMHGVTATGRQVDELTPGDRRRIV